MDTNHNNYQHILSFESKKDDSEMALADRDAKIKQLEEEKAETLQESKRNADLPKEVKESHIQIEIVYRDEIKQAHAEEEKLK